MKTKSILTALAVAVLGAATIPATPPLNTAFTYQGRLNDGGAPANGNYDMIFNLYDAPTNGNVLGSFSIFGAVPVSNGLFTLELNSYGEFGSNAFNGQPRWLQVGVRTNNNNALNPWVNLSPRQPVDPAPQAMFALNASNSVFAQNASFATTVADGSVTGAKLAPGAVTWSNIAGLPAGFADGVDNDTHYFAGAGLGLNATNQFSVTFGGSGSANAAARSDHNHFGASWGGTTAFGLGLSVTNGAANSTGLYGQQGTGSGFPYPFGNTAGVWGESSQGSGVYGASATFRGVQGVSLGAQGAGLYGTALSSSGTNFGVYGKTSSTNGGVGIYGQAAVASTNSQKAALGSISTGVIGDSGQGVGVAGFSDNFPGTYGGSQNYIGVLGESRSASGAGVVAVNSYGAGLKVSGTGIIQSDAETVMWFPAAFLPNDMAYKPTLFPNGVYVEVGNSQVGSTSVVMPLNLPGTLYGQQVWLKQVDLFFQCSNGARSYPTGANLYLVQTDGTFSQPDSVSLNATGNAMTKVTLAPNIYLSSAQGFISLYVGAYFGNTADKIRFAGARVVLKHT